MKHCQSSDTYVTTPPAAVRQAGGFAVLKHTILAGVFFCMLGLWLVTPACAQNSTPVKAKTPDTKSNSFFKPYSHPNKSRFSWMAGVGVGAYSGDICRLSDGRLQHHYFNPGLSAGLSYQLTNYIAARWDNTYQLLRAGSRPETWGNWSFRSHVWTSTVGVQINLISRTRLERDHMRWDGYLLAGGGILFYQTRLSAEAEQLAASNSLLAKSKHPIAAVFPVGIGGSRYLSNRWSVGLECTYRFTTTDLLDGASLVNDPRPRKDDYLMVRVYVTKQIFQIFRYNDYMKRK